MITYGCLLAVVVLQPVEAHSNIDLQLPKWKEFHANWPIPFTSLLGVSSVPNTPPPNFFSPIEVGPLSFLSVGHNAQRAKRSSDIVASRTTAKVHDGGLDSSKKTEEIPYDGNWLHRLSFWIHCITFALVIKTLCILSNIGMALAPMTNIQEIRKAKETGSYDSLPFLSIMSTGSQWCFYGVFAWMYTGNKGFLVILYANAPSAVLGVFYCYSFIKFCKNMEVWRVMLIYVRMLTFVFVGQFSVLYFIPMEKGLLFCGSIACLLSILVTISPLSTLKEVHANRSIESVPIGLSMASYFSSFVWVICGVMLVDLWILIPNILGIAVGTYITYLIMEYSPLFDPVLSIIFPSLSYSHKKKMSHASFPHPKMPATEQTPLKASEPTYTVSSHSARILAQVLGRAAERVNTKEEKVVLEQYRDSVLDVADGNVNNMNNMNNSIHSPFHPLNHEDYGSTGGT